MMQLQNKFFVDITLQYFLSVHSKPHTHTQLQNMHVTWWSRIDTRRLRHNHLLLTRLCRILLLRNNYALLKQIRYDGCFKCRTINNCSADMDVNSLIDSIFHADPKNALLLKQTIHIISFEPISRRSSANYFHELSMTSVSIGTIGEFLRATKRQLVRIV